MRTDGQKGFVFVNHYQRLYELEDVENAVIDTGAVKFPGVDVCGDVSFFMPFNMELGENVLEYATVQPLCRIDNTYFFTAIDKIKPQYKFKGTSTFSPDEGECFEFNGIKVVTLSFDEAKKARKLSGKLYIGDVYECNGELCLISDGSCSYKLWNGEAFEEKHIVREFEQAKVDFEAVEEPFVPPYIDELNIGGERERTWKKVTVSGSGGFVEICDQYDAAQIYADGELAADNFYYGEAWRVPAKLLYGKECYLVMSQMKDDFYKEF